MMFTFGMRGKISLFLVVIVIIPIAILGSVSLRSQDQMLDDTLRNMNRGFKELIAFQVFRVVSSSRNQLVWLSFVSAIRKGDATTAAKLLDSFLATHPTFDGVSLFDRAKRRIAHGGKAIRLKDKSNLFSAAVFDVYGGIRFEVEDGQRHKQLLLKEPVYDAHGELAGVLVASLKLSQLGRTLKEILAKLARTYDNLDIYVLDPDEQIIVSNHRAEFAQRIVFPPEELEKEVKEKKNPPKPIRDFHPYETPDWKILTIPKPTARASLKEMMGFLKQLTLWMVVAATVLGLLFAGTITYPLRDLVVSAMTISKGDLSQPVEVHSRDEIGELADKFDFMRVNLKKMQDNLRAKIEELQSLYGMGKAISGTLDFKELLNIVLQMVVQTTKANRASIMLLDEKSEELRIMHSHGLPDKVVTGTRVRLGERISGHVLATGRPLLIYDTFKSPNFANLKDGKIAAGTLMSVPLIAKEKRLGVLNVSKKQPYSFAERDLELMSALANQAAMAIDNARLYMLAITDELTKLYIRRFFLQRLQEELRRARRYRGLLTVMIVDIDHFKSFNDTYGHQAGDEVLVYVAKTFQKCVRKVDIVSRLGGEEFAILCPEQSVDEACVPAERIRKSVEGSQIEIGTERTKVNVTVSIGLADYPLDAEDQHGLIEKADQALYQAKNTGRNRVICYRDVAEQLQKNGGAEKAPEPSPVASPKEPTEPKEEKAPKKAKKSVAKKSETQKSETQKKDKAEKRKEKGRGRSTVGKSEEVS